MRSTDNTEIINNDMLIPQDNIEIITVICQTVCTVRNSTI